MATDEAELVFHYRISFLSVFLLHSLAFAWTEPDPESVLKKMAAAYEKAKDYQTRLEIKARRRDGSFTTKEILYTFKKPHWIRLDFESPYRGMVLVYPDPNGKVVVKPGGWARSLQLHLAPDNFLLKVSRGQRIDQTDLGLLIKNISHSLTEHRRGPVTVEEHNRHIRLRVLADDHFRKGVVTLYQFLVDRDLWLPVGVEESTPDGILQRTVVFRSLKVNTGIPDSFFQLDGD